MSIKSLIIDDEKGSIELLKALLESHCPKVEVAAEARNVESGIQAIKEIQPNLIFLDINMPDGDGFEIMQAFPNPKFEVIFTTAYNQYALKAFEFSALHYLLKPINIDQLKSAVNRVKTEQYKPWQQRAQLLKEGLKGSPQKIALAHKQGYEFVEIRNIIRIEGEDSYSRFFLKAGRELLVSRSIGEYEKLLYDQDFFRVHKKHLINLKCMTSFQRGKQGIVLLENGEEIPLSYRRKDEFLERIKHGIVF